MLALVTATLNSIKTIEESFASTKIISDKVKQFFVDGGSIDGTVDRLQEFANSAGNVVVRMQDGTGLYEALNQGTQAALVDPVVTYVGILHSDDRLIPDSFRDYLSYIERNREDIYYSDIEFHDINDNVVRIWRSGNFSTFKLNTGWMPPHTSMIVSKKIYEEVGLYDPTFGTAADYDWIVRVLTGQSVSVKYFPKRTVSMRVGGASGASIRARLRANAMDGKVWAKRSRLHAILVRVCKPLRKIGQFKVRKGTL